MTEHTKGRLNLNQPNKRCRVLIRGGDDRRVIATVEAHSENDPDARRLVACWNALVGVDTDFIERVTQSPGFTIIEHLLRDRDELIGALRTLVRDFDAIGEDEQVPEAININEHWDAAHALLAKHAPKVPA
jgi:hypothetical protein